MDTPKFKIKKTFIAGISLFLLYAILASFCYALYWLGDLSDLFLVTPTYWNWVSLVFISSIIFNKIPIDLTKWKQSN